MATKKNNILKEIFDGLRDRPNTKRLLIDASVSWILVDLLSETEHTQFIQDSTGIVVEVAGIPVTFANDLDKHLFFCE